MYPGAITIALRNTGGSLAFEMANSGKGIRKEDLPNVFRKFYRGTPAPIADPGGIGLGLTIAQAIANAHHGQIAIESCREGWTTVRLSLPTRTMAA